MIHLFMQNQQLVIVSLLTFIFNLQPVEFIEALEHTKTVRQAREERIDIKCRSY